LLNLRVELRQLTMDFYQWTAVAVIVAVAVCAWLAIKALLRHVPPFAVTPRRAEAGPWDAQYRSDWRRGLAEGLVAWLASSVVIGIALSALARALAPEAEIRLAPNLLLWLIPAALLAAPVGALVWRLRRARAVGTDRERVLRSAHEQYQRLRDTPLSALKATLAGVAGVTGALLLADWQLHLAPQQLTWDPLWKQERAYSYADVRTVEALQSRKSWHGEIVREPSYRIRLADGRAWESWRVSHGKTSAELAQVMQLVAQRAGRPIETLDPYPRGLPAAPRAQTGAERNTAPSS
jgi:hypothetical protein